MIAPENTNDGRIIIASMMFYCHVISIVMFKTAKYVYGMSNLEKDFLRDTLKTVLRKT